MVHDLIVAARALAKRPAYALSVILTLTLGIGASTMMFSLLDAALIRPLPFDRPERLLMLQGVFGRERDVRGASFPEVLDWRSMNRTLEDVSVYSTASLNLRIGHEAVRVASEVVSAGYFSLLGVRPSLGRTFRPDEDQTFDAAAVAVISHKLWRERFGSSPDVLTKTIALNDRQFTIVGVMPERFAGLSFTADLWMPSMMLSLTSPDADRNRANRWLFAIGRPRDGVTVEQAQADMTRVASILEQQYPDSNRERGVQLVTVTQAFLGNSASLLAALFGAVLLFLLIACANVASLQLARTLARRRELAVRLALGAGRWRIVRYLLAESLVLSSAAGLAGALLAAWGMRAVILAMPEGALPPHVEPVVDLRSLLFTITSAFLCGGLVTVLPAVVSSRRDLATEMKTGGRAIAAGLGRIRRPSIQQLIVVGEIALAMTLLTGAGLLAHSLSRQLRVSPRFDPTGVTAASISLPPGRYAPEARGVFVERLQQALGSLPGVAAAAIGTDLPLRMNANASRLVADVDPLNSIRYYRHRVSPDYFRTLRIALVAGRLFTDQDRREAARVAIVNDAAARRIWGGANQAVGRIVRLGTGTVPVQVIGVAGDVRFRDLTTDITVAGAEPDVYVPFAQSTDWDLDVAVRSTNGAAVSVGSIQQAVSTIDPGLPVYNVQLLDDAYARQTATLRFASTLLGLFSTGALLLAALGAYGLIAYVVSLSGREVAIRLALGADRRQVIKQIVANGMLLVVAGISIGCLGAWLAAGALETQLFETRPTDPATFAAVGLTLSIVALIAIFLPARKASLINPSVALQAE
jgi:putative ABC transport system permease protein